MILGYRLCSGRYAANDFTGSKLYGGRWNRVGTGVIYTSSSPSLAALEVLAQYEVLPRNYVLTQIELPESVGIKFVENHELPIDWQAEPPAQMPAAGHSGVMELSQTQLYGMMWINQAHSAVLSVPSAVMGTDWSTERNYVINPHHSRFYAVNFGEPKPFRFDPRLK